MIREVADDDIASLLGTEEGAVRGRREDALALLAAVTSAPTRAEEVGILVREMRELPAVALARRRRAARGAAHA